MKLSPDTMTYAQLAACILAMTPEQQAQDVTLHNTDTAQLFGVTLDTVDAEDGKLSAGTVVISFESLSEID